MKIRTSNSIFTILTLIIVLLASCDKEPSPTVFEGTVVRESTGNSVPDATLLLVPRQPINIGTPDRILERYFVPTDESGAFSFTVPADIEGEEPTSIDLTVYTGGIPGEFPEPDDIFNLYGSDIILEGDVGDATNAQSFAPGRTYDFTIRLLR